MKNYLNDKHFLKQLDNEREKTQYIRITLLDFKTEVPIAAIEGKATGGSINLNGSSNMRRAMSCSLAVSPNGIYDMRYNEYVDYYNITEVENLVSLNKKAQAEIGFINTLAHLGEGYYPDYDIIWIPLGIYIIKSANISKNNSGVNMSLSFNDKTAQLNGDVGGVIPAATVLSESELYNADASQRIVEQLLIKDLIKHLVVDFGGEDPNNVIIEDIPDTIRKVMKWIGNESLYYDKNNKTYVTEEPDDFDEGNGDREFSTGEDCGYAIEPFHYPGKLECNAGETVAAMLDKIKNTLGNYEWFYDVNGKFHFQEKKNYLNNSYKPQNYNDLKNSLQYLPTMNMSKNVYTFDDTNRHLITSISNNPQYQNIKNDFIVWGTKKTAAGVSKPIRYHLVLQSKPTVDSNKKRLCIVYTDYRGLQQVIILNDKNKKDEAAPDTNTPTEEQKRYYYLSTVESEKVVEHWDEENQCFRVFDEWEVCYLKTNDWRTELYFKGLEDANKAFAKNYYAAELNAEWPKIYDVKGELVSPEGEIIPVYEGAYRELSLNQYEYYLDFLSPGSEEQVTSQFNVDKIGRRIKIGKDNGANCVFTEEPPNIIFINADGDTADDYENAISGYDFVQVSEEIYSKLALGGNDSPAYEKVKELLVQHTVYNEAITLTTIPIYYLEPNTRIHIEDNDTAVNGDYIINSISLPFGIGTSNISCTRCLERTI